MATSFAKAKNWLEKVLETPFYEAEMARATAHNVKRGDLIIVVLASSSILVLSLFFP